MSGNFDDIVAHNKGAKVMAALDKQLDRTKNEEMSKSLVLTTRDGATIEVSLWPLKNGGQIVGEIYKGEDYDKQFSIDENSSKNRPEEFKRYMRMFKDASVKNTDGGKYTQEELDRKKAPLYHRMMMLSQGRITESYFGY